MILCCKHCGNCRESNHLAENCDYCGNEMVQLLSDEELSHIDPKELPQNHRSDACRLSIRQSGL